MNTSLDNLDCLDISLKPGDIIYLIGDLGAGKTTLTKHLLEKHGINPSLVRSPTYTYMQEYDGFTTDGKSQKFHHFDLYRLESYDDFLNIGGQEYLENPHSIKIIEWPEILEGYISPDCIITIKIPSNSEEEREYIIMR